MHSCPQFWLLWRQCPFFSAFSSTVFMWRNFSNCPLISLLRCGAREIREYYLALTLPLFHWPRILLVSLYIFLEIIWAYSIGKFEVIKRGYCGEGVRLLQREWEESVRELSRSVRLLATDQLAVFAQSRPCIREGNEMNWGLREVGVYIT